jgi:hypothetical protein
MINKSSIETYYITIKAYEQEVFSERYFLKLFRGLPFRNRVSLREAMKELDFLKLRKFIKK